MSAYKGAKGSVQFPLDQPLPLDLVRRVVELRVKENVEHALAKKSKRTCSKGHTFYKSSDCPTCSVCAKINKPAKGFLLHLSAPARRALEREGITTLEQLSTQTESSLLALHGVGPTTIPKLRSILEEAGLRFKE